MEQLLEETTQAIREFARNSKELLRVGIFASLPKEEVIFPLVDYFLTSCPEYQFNLEMIELEEGRRKLMDGKLDLLLTNIHEEDDIHDFSAYSFEQHEVKIVVSARHPWSKKESVTEEDLLSFFRAAKRSILPGGALIFDVSTPYKLKEILCAGLMCEDRENITYLWQNTWHERSQTVNLDLCFFVRENDGKYRRMEENGSHAHAHQKMGPAGTGGMPLLRRFS